MATPQQPVELAGVNLAGQNHVCAFFNATEEQHRVASLVLQRRFRGGFAALLSKGVQVAVRAKINLDVTLRVAGESA